jgi:hypothetical protein
MRAASSPSAQSVLTVDVEVPAEQVRRPLSPIFSPPGRASALLQDAVDARGERLDVVGSTAGNIATRSWLRPELAVRARRRRSRSRAGSGDARGVDALVEVDRPDDERALGRSATNGAA